MECESEGKISYDHAVEAALVLKNSLAGESRGKCQTVARVNLGPEIAEIFLKILLGSTCDNAEILGDEVLPKKVFLKRISSYFGPHRLWQLSALTATSTNQCVPRTSWGAHLKCHHLPLFSLLKPFYP